VSIAGEELADGDADLGDHRGGPSREEPLALEGDPGGGPTQVLISRAAEPQLGAGLGQLTPAMAEHRTHPCGHYADVLYSSATCRVRKCPTRAAADHRSHGELVIASVGPWNSAATPVADDPSAMPSATSNHRAGRVAPAAASISGANPSRTLCRGRRSRWIGSGMARGWCHLAARPDPHSGRSFRPATTGHRTTPLSHAGWIPGIPPLIVSLPCG
jgi:hypothetical protein